MKVKNTGAVLLLMLTLAGCTFYRATDTEQISIDEPFDRLVIISQVGNITVQKAPDNATGVELTAEKFAQACTKDQAQQYLEQIAITVEVDNNICTITVSLPKMKPPNISGGADLTITGIEDLPLDIDLNVGSIACDTMNGGTISNNVGDITIQEAAGDIELAIDTGSIGVADYSGSMCSLRTGVGSADITISGSGPIDGSITAGAGEIACAVSENRSAAFKLQTGVGGISITGITGYTLTGFVSLQASFELGAAEGTFTMETGTGSIDIDVF